MTRLRKLPAWLVVPAGLALVVRVAVVVGQLRYHVLNVSYDAADSVLYRGIADQVLHHGRLWISGRPTAYVTPAYPMFLAGLYTFGRSTLFIALVQCVLGALTVALIADTARRLSGVTAAWVAGLLAAGYPHLIFWTGYVLTETFFVFVLAVAVWLLVILVQRPDPPPWLPVLVGATLVAAALTRPELFGFAVLLAVAGLATKRWRRVAVLACVGMAVLWVPWVVRNQVSMHAFVPTSTETGLVLWQGNSPDANGGTRGYVDNLDFKPLARLHDLPEVEQDREYRSAAVSWMLHHPTKVVTLAPRKLANMFRPAYAGASRFNVAVTLLSYPVVALAGLAGLVVLARRRDLAGRLLVAFIAYELVVHALVTGMIRFRLPIEAMLCIAAGVAVEAAFAARRRSAR